MGEKDRDGDGERIFVNMVCGIWLSALYDGFGPNP